MKTIATIFKAILAGLATSMLMLPSLHAAQIDWAKVRELQGKEFLTYVESLDLKDQQALDFWKRIPVSNANKQVQRLFRKESFAIYMTKYPRPKGRAESFTPGMGTEAIGPISLYRLSPSARRSHWGSKQDLSHWLHHSRARSSLAVEQRRLCSMGGPASPQC